MQRKTKITNVKSVDVLTYVKYMPVIYLPFSKPHKVGDIYAGCTPCINAVTETLRVAFILPVVVIRVIRC